MGIELLAVCRAGLVKYTGDKPQTDSLPLSSTDSASEHQVASGGLALGSGHDLGNMADEMSAPCTDRHGDFIPNASNHVDHTQAEACDTDHKTSPHGMANVAASSRQDSLARSRSSSDISDAESHSADTAHISSARDIDGGAESRHQAPSPTHSPSHADFSPQHSSRSDLHRHTDTDRAQPPDSPFSTGSHHVTPESSPTLNTAQSSSHPIASFKAPGSNTADGNQASKSSQEIATDKTALQDDATNSKAALSAGAASGNTTTSSLADAVSDQAARNARKLQAAERSRLQAQAMRRSGVYRKHGMGTSSRSTSSIGSPSGSMASMSTTSGWPEYSPSR